MVGEIRDAETAEHAVQAALTGHLVLSTLHTNDASSSITRLLDLEVPHFLITSTLIGVVAQRLVREICTHCTEEYEPTEAEAAAMKIPFEKLRPYRFRRGKGCLHCRETGYLGRTGIYEILPMTEKIRRLISNQAGSLDIFKAAREEGLRTLKEAGDREGVPRRHHRHRDGAGDRQMNDDGLKGRVVLVTGSGRGLGRALACAAGAEKARVVVEHAGATSARPRPSRRRSRAAGARRSPCAPTSPTSRRRERSSIARSRSGAGSTCSSTRSAASTGTRSWRWSRRSGAGSSPPTSTRCSTCAGWSCRTCASAASGAS